MQLPQLADGRCELAFRFRRATLRFFQAPLSVSDEAVHLVGVISPAVGGEDRRRLRLSVG